MTAIQTNHMAFHAGAFRLHDISLSIPSECMTAIVGPNGSGKSTLLKLMSQLLLPDQGEIYIRGKQAKTYPAIALAKIVSMLTQSKHSLPDMTVRELVSYGRSPYKRLFDRMTADDERIVDWAMEVTGTKRHEQRMFHTLSGGEQQKARIAMALAQKRASSCWMNLQRFWISHISWTLWKCCRKLIGNTASQSSWCFMICSRLPVTVIT